MFPIPPIKPPITVPVGTTGVPPVEKISDRAVPLVTPSPNESERRTRQDRREQSLPRLKGYDLRSGRDRRKSPRSGPSIDIDV